MSSLKQFSIFLDPYYWRTARLIARNNLAKQYRNTYLGMLWTLFQPLTMVIVYSIVMPLIMRFPAENYVLYILCTMPLWNTMAGILIGSSSSLLAQADTLKRCMISSTVFPVSDVLRHLYTYSITFVTMYGFAILIGMPVTWKVLLVPLFMIPTILTLMSLSVGIAFAAPYIRDIGEVIMVGMNVMLWFSAVPYPISAIPEQYRWVFHYNPFYIMLNPTISLVYEHTIPGVDIVARSLALMLLALAVGYSMYRRCRRNFVYYL